MDFCKTMPTDNFETDIHENGDPLELDLVLSSDLPHHADFADSNLEEQGPGSAQPFQGLDDDVCLDDDLLETDGGPQVKKGRSKANKTPVVLTENEDGTPVSVFQRLVDFGLLKKVTDIVMAKVSMPWNLRDDASQEVHTTWARLVVNPQFERNQIARYAYMSGQHAALKLRRDIGAVVTIPGALFRTGRNTSFMESIGAAVNPKDVDDYKDSLELSIQPDDMMHLAKVSDAFFDERMHGLGLTSKQRTVARMALVERKQVDDIAEELKIELVYVERLLNQVTLKLRAANGEDVPVRQNKRKPRAATPADAAEQGSLAL